MCDFNVEVAAASLELHVHLHCGWPKCVLTRAPLGMEPPLVKRLPALSPHAIPAGAYRLIIDFCGRDPSFCHLIIPHFQDDCLVLLLLSENGEKFIAQRRRPREQDPPEKATTCPAS